MTTRLSSLVMWKHAPALIIQCSELVAKQAAPNHAQSPSMGYGACEGSRQESAGAAVITRSTGQMILKYPKVVPA
eukprot:3490672-Pleurochrysis_carterae.AAC.2